MSPRTRYAKKHAKASRRPYPTAHERLKRDRRQAQHAAEALHQALKDLGLPEALVPEIEGRLRSQHKLLGKIVGVMCPPLFGCRTSSELCRVRGWDKNLPSRLLGALPKRSWLKRLRRLGLEVLEPLWRHAASTSAATRSRWQWTWVADDSVFKKYGDQISYHPQSGWFEDTPLKGGTEEGCPLKGVHEGTCLLRLGSVRRTTLELLSSHRSTVCPLSIARRIALGAVVGCGEAGLPHKMSSAPPQRRNGRAL